MPVNFSNIKEHLVEFDNRAPKTPKIEINALKANPDTSSRLVCYRCSGEHYAKQCKISFNQVKCEQCNKNGHSTKNHHLLAKMLNTLQEEKPETRKESGVFACQPEATSFITGEINVENTGNKFVVCPKILIDTGALVPSGIAVSEDFFVDHLALYGDYQSTKVSPFVQTLFLMEPSYPWVYLEHWTCKLIRIVACIHASI